METMDTSVKIKFLVEMAIQGEISGLALDSVINRLTPTLEKSRQIIRILLKQFETHQIICTIKASNNGNNLSEDITEINEQQSNIDEVTFEGNKVFNVTIYILAQIYDVDILTGSKNAKFCFFLVGLCPH